MSSFIPTAWADLTPLFDFDFDFQRREPWPQGYGAVYAYIDRRDEEIYYVGKTVQRLRARLNGHLSEARRARRLNARTAWFQELLAAGEEPEICLLHIGLRAQLKAVEDHCKNVLR